MKSTTIPNELIEEISIFGGIDREYIDRIIEHCDRMKFSAGQLLYKEGDPATEIFIILSGKIKLVHNYEENPYELIELIPGNSLGETSVIGIEPHASTAVVTDNCEVLVLSRKIMNRIHEVEPEVFTVLILNIARELARRLHKNRKTMLELKIR